MEGNDRAKPGRRFGALALISAVARDKNASKALNPAGGLDLTEEAQHGREKGL
jgi:hypothetical protein